MKEVYEVYEGVVMGDGKPIRVYDDRSMAENAADDMAMSGLKASVYEVKGPSRT